MSEPIPIFGVSQPDAPAALPGVAETLRVLRFADPPLETSSALSFRPLGDPQRAWQLWQHSVFRRGVQPLLCDLLDCAAHEHAHDILALDRELDGVYEVDAAARSRILGWKLLRDYRPPRAARALGKLREWSLQSGRSLHYASVFAARCGVFNIAPAQACAAYLFKEWHCGFEGELPLGELPVAPVAPAEPAPPNLQIVSK